MNALPLLLAGLALLQPADGAGELLAPRWSIGQELVYRGVIQETSAGQGVQFAKTYGLEARLFILDRPQPGVFQAACLTRLSLAAADRAKNDAVSLRLEVGTLDELGQFLPRLPRRAYGDFEGPASHEDAYILELPRGGRAGSAWTLETPGEPHRRLQLVGLENHAGSSCLKLSIQQQAEEWDQPRGDRSAWKVETFLWIQPRTGQVQKVQRTLLGRPAAHREPTYRLVAVYELESQLRHEGAFGEDRKRDILQHQQFLAQLRSLSSPGARTLPTAYAAFVERLDLYLRKQPATPYRDALVRLREQALSAAQRQLPAPVIDAGADAPAKEKLAAGQPAPDFIVRSLDGKEAAGLRTWKGKPVLLIFFQPGSGSSALLLPAMQRLHESQGADAAAILVGMALADDEELLRRCRQQFNLTLPLFAGRPLLESYDVRTTPCFVLVDAHGRVAGQRTGWGPETAAALAAELKRLANVKPPA